VHQRRTLPGRKKSWRLRFQRKKRTFALIFFHFSAAFGTAGIKPIATQTNENSISFK
jgi:hypothetical protein